MNTCVEGDEGKKLLLKAEKDTKDFAKTQLKNVPTVVFNNVCVLFLIFFLSQLLTKIHFSLNMQNFDPQLQDKAVSGLKTAFCELLSKADYSIPECA